MGLLQNVREVFKMLRYRKPSKIYCPRCGSQKIHLSSGLDFWLTPKKYVCDECGYTGSIVMEIEKEKENSA